MRPNISLSPPFRYTSLLYPPCRNIPVGEARTLIDRRSKW